MDPKDPGPPQFSIVHGVKVSNDGLVYVSDRSGKRVQVFTIDGRFVTQTFVDRWCEAPRGSNLFCGSGDTVASTAFSADPAQRFLYVASRSPAPATIASGSVSSHQRATQAPTARATVTMIRRVTKRDAGIKPRQ